MQHIHAATCPECERDLYLIISGIIDDRWLGNFDFYHLDEACPLYPIEPSLRDAAYGS